MKREVALVQYRELLTVNYECPHPFPNALSAGANPAVSAPTFNLKNRSPVQQEETAGHLFGIGVLSAQ
jgi:hypothetical protein